MTDTFEAFEIDGAPWMGRSTDDEPLTPVCTLEDFWRDPFTAAARASASAPAEAGSRPRVVPVPAAARVICVGLNYRAHAAEGAFDVPDHPTIFGRWTRSLSVGGRSVAVPHNEDGLDWEGEVAVYVGREVRDATEEDAEAAIFGYSTFNDLTARRAQKLTAQWTLGKNVDASGPLGPIVPWAEIGDLRTAALGVRTRVNGTEVQNGNTQDMLFSPARIISEVSRTFTLHPGDVIASGTPEGVGYVRTPPWLLGAGDVVEVEVDRLGVVRTTVT